MENTNRRYVRIGFAIAVGIFIGYGQLALAGFYSYSDSFGKGQADTRVRNGTSTLSNRFVTVTTNFVSSGFNTNLTLTVRGTWTNHTPTRAFSMIGSRGLITNKGTPTNGDAIDSGDPTLDSLVVPSSACPSIELISEPVDVTNEQNQIDPFAFRYVLNVHGSDAGTALKVIWYDWLVQDGPPADRDDLIANGRKLAEFVFVGPVDLANYDCILIRSSRGREFIHVVTAGTAVSLPFNITCPADIVVGCNQLLQYPDASALTITGGVAPYTVTFDPPADQLADAVTNTVTATATDANGCTAGPCHFFIVRNAASTFDGFQSPISGVGGTCAAPLRTVRRGSILPVKFKATCDGVPITTAPHVEVRNCVTGQILVSGDAIQETSAVWHFNVDTSLSIFANVTIEIVVNLPGGYTKTAVIKLKN